MSNAPFLPLLLTIIEAVGTLAFALSGLLEAARKRLDAVGVCLVAGLAAFGGGTLRGGLLDRRPFVGVARRGGGLATCAARRIAQSVRRSHAGLSSERQWN